MFKAITIEGENEDNEESSERGKGYGKKSLAVIVRERVKVLKEN
jgi:hypothetical protein